MKVSTILEAMTDKIRPEHIDEIAAVARIRRAHKFKVQLSSEGFETALDYAFQMNEFGIFTIPFDETYFETEIEELGGGWLCVGVICWREGAMIFARVYDWTRRSDGTVVCNSGSITFDLLSFRRQAKLAIETRLFPRSWVDAVPLPSDDNSPATLEVGAALGAAMAFVCVGALTLRGASREPVAISEKLTKARIRRGREPFYSHTVVRVRADPGKPGVSHGVLLGDRSGPRLHWRRGHIRRLPGGALTQVRPCLVGDRSAGIVTHDYQVAV